MKRFIKPRWLRVFAWILGVAIILIASLWLILVWYIQSHKKSVLHYITTHFSEQIDGRLVIKDMQPSFWRGFPDVSLVLTGITIRDSLFEQHHHSLADIKMVYVRLNSLKLLQKKIDIKKLTAVNGSFYFFTDSTGYSNTYLLSKKDSAKKSNTKFDCKNFALENISVTMEEQKKRKHFAVKLNSAEGFAVWKNNRWQTYMKLDGFISDLTFNKEKGGFLTNKTLVTHLHTQYNPAKKLLTFNNQLLKIDGLPMLFSASFSFLEKTPLYRLHFHSTIIPFDTVATWLSHSIYVKLKDIHIVKPMLLDGYLHGHIKYRDTPVVKVMWTTVNTEMKTPYARFTNCSFSGMFLNVVKPGHGHGDPNSMTVLRNATGKWNEIPIYADSVRVDNLSYPLLQFSVQSDFSLASLNHIPGGIPFSFNAGKASVRVYYKGGTKTEDTLYPQVHGNAQIVNGAFTYVPRGLSFNNTSATLLFQGDDLLLNDITIHSPHSVLKMKGYALHFFRFYFTQPQKVIINWQAESADLNLADFLVFVGKRKSATVENKSGRGSQRILRQLDTVLNLSNINLQAIFNRLYYKRFIATNVVATASLSQSEIELKEIKLHHANGSLQLSGKIQQDAIANPFSLKASLSNISVDKLFYSFENFGQTTITDSNILGTLNANANITGNLTEGGKIVSRSLNGFINFSLKDGVLLHFKPLENIGKIIFRNRDMSHIIFKNLSNRFEIKGEKIIIPPMNIVSSALYAKAQGVYSTDTGTDISIEIPFRNPKKDGFDTTSAYHSQIPNTSGLTLYLRAKDDDEGKVKISWDPLKKGVKATDSISRTKATKSKR